MNREKLDRAIESIRDYTGKHPALSCAHHFLYDLPLDKKAGRPKIVVMGINPGESERDRQACHGPTEETWNHDFHETVTSGRSRGSKNWRKNAIFFADGQSVVFTELFFWSSSNLVEFRQRYGGPWWASQHLAFCVEKNRILISEYRPKSVIFTGIGSSNRVAEVFGLQLVDTRKSGGSRLVVHYRDEFRPWFFTKHWSGSFGFSNNQKLAIKNYIRAHARA